MPEESTTPDLLELARRSVEVVNRGDVDAALSNWGPDSVWDDSAIGLGTHEGLTAIREHGEDWMGSYEEFEIEIEQALDLGNGVTFSVALQKGRPLGSIGHVQLRYATVTAWVEGIIERFTTYLDADEARAAAERLAEERPMSEESMTPDLVERVRAAFEAYGRADFEGTVRFFAPDAVWEMKGGETFQGIATIRVFMEEFHSHFEGFEVEVEEIRDLGCDAVLAINTMRGHPLGSAGEVWQRGAFIYEAKDGLAVRVTSYNDIDEGRAVAERLAEERG
jgi:ketosteroid isomerase-like protein